MPPDFTEHYIYATIHDFKTNISRYLKFLESDMYKAVIVKRRNTPVAMVLPFERMARDTLTRAEGGEP